MRIKARKFERSKRPKILFFVTEDWFFCSHFLDRAIAARREGYEVSVVTRVQNHSHEITSQGLKLVPLKLLRRSFNPWLELQVISKLIRIYKSEQADIVHHVALKPILYGTMAASIVGGSAIVNAPVGMGYVFSSDQKRANFLRPLIRFGYRLFLSPRHGCVVLENKDDQEMLADAGILDIKRTRVIRGAGVDLVLFAPTRESEGVPVVVLAARMLWDKGVREFVDAARRLREEGVKARFVLVGDRDAGNPAAIPAVQLQTWQSSGVIEWWGHRDDMPRVLSQAHIVCLPSYREGLPKVLLEAAASGRAIVTTDVPGCREIVRHDDNGLLVPARNSAALANALRRLIDDPALRHRMGRRGREIAVQEFGLERIVAETLALYRMLLAEREGGALQSTDEAPHERKSA